MRKSGYLLSENKKLAPYLIGCLYSCLGIAIILPMIFALTGEKEYMVTTMCGSLVFLLLTGIITYPIIRIYRIYSMQYCVDGSIITNQYQDKQTAINITQPFSICRLVFKRANGKTPTQLIPPVLLLWNTADIVEIDDEALLLHLNDALEQGAVLLPDEEWSHDFLSQYVQTEAIPSYPEFFHHNT